VLLYDEYLIIMTPLVKAVTRNKIRKRCSRLSKYFRDTTTTQQRSRVKLDVLAGG
jgi:hypothetical protein